MNRITKHNLALTALALTLWQWQPTTLKAGPDKTADIFPDPVVATGRGFQIKRSQVDDAFLNYSANFEAQNRSSIPEDRRGTIRSNLLQHLIITKILVQKATADDKAKIQLLVDEDIAKARKAAATPEVFEAQIKASGMTLAQVRDRACEDLLCKRILERETTNGIIISDAAVRKFYDDNAAKFEEPEEVRVSHILISTIDPVTQKPVAPEQKKVKEKLAKDIRARALNGEDFVKLVKQYSDDPGSKDKGGEYKFPRNQMVPEFEAAAFSLKTNQISELVETQFGYHIIKLLQKYQPRHEPFSEVEVKIKGYLVEQKAEDALPAYLDKIKAEAGVKPVEADTGRSTAR
jgi:peptidyl-prolyl cis-trans isomerase C